MLNYHEHPETNNLRSLEKSSADNVRPFVELNASQGSHKNEHQVRDQRENDKLELDGKVKVFPTAFDDWSELIVVETSSRCHSQYVDTQTRGICATSTSTSMLVDMYGWQHEQSR